MGDVRCDKIFKTYIEQGEQVKYGEKREFESICTPRDDKLLAFDIYSIDRKPTQPVQYTTDERCKKVGEIRTKAPPELKTKRLDVKITIEFGGTELKASFEFIGTNYKSSTTVNFF